MKVLETPLIFTREKKCIFSSARFKRSALPRTQVAGFWLVVTALHGNQSFELGGEK